MVGLLGFALGSAHSLVAQEAQTVRPNFIIFLTDDLGYGDLGCYGHKVIKTPNLDQFATQSLKFTQCYSACPVCSPSRSAILTGRTPYRNGVFTWLPEGVEIHLRRSEITLATLLRNNGYATCHVGKWHLNSYFNDPRQPQPNDHGYDHWYATQNNAAPNHKNPKNFVRNGQPVGPQEGYSSHLVVEEAIQWLQKQRDPQKPFFLTVWTHEPHLPIESAPEYQDLYKDLADPDLRQHHGNITQMDAAFGKLMKALDAMNLTNTTFVCFTSDNGPEGNGNTARTRGSTGGLRGRKRAVYEGGIRVPGLIRWPGRVTPGVSEEPIIGSDLFSTICEAVNVAVPNDRTIDGISLSPVFLGKALERRIPMYWRYHGAPGPMYLAMRQGDYKILANLQLNQFELYNLRTDPQEMRNLVDQEPQRFAALRDTLIRLNEQIEAEGPDWWKDYKRK